MARTPEHPLVAEIPHLRRYARALMGDAGRADDLVQDCLARAYGRLHLWRRGSNLRTWLFTIMHNLHANAVRAEARRPRVVPFDTILDPPQRATQHDALELAAINAALAALPEDQRRVVLLIGLEDMSYRDAARVLGVPIGTVMSRLHRARERLRDLLSPAGVELRRVK